MLAGPASLDARSVENLDQFVMRGGALVVLDGRFRLALNMGGGGLSVEKVTTGLEQAFQKWGVTVEDQMVMDSKHEAFPLPVPRNLGNGLMIQEIRQVPYPFFVKIDGENVSGGWVQRTLVAPKAPQ